MADGLLNKASIILTPTGYKAGTLYNVAPVVEPYEDFDFARASVASRVNSSGLVEMVGRTLGSELVTNGGFDTDSDWTLGTGWSIGDGKATSDGSQAISNLYQTVGTFTNKTFLVEGNASNVSQGFAYISLGGSDLQIVVNSSGSFKHYVTISSGNDILYISARSNFIGSIDNVSVKEIIDTNNIPRINYDGNGDNGHILLEPTSTNLITYSEDFSQSFYIKDSGVSVSTTNNVSPSGEFNATKIDVTDNGRIYANVTSDTYVSSVFIKAGTFSYFRFVGSNVDLVAGTFSGGTIESFANGWFRISKVLTTFRPFQIQAYPDGTYSSHTTSGNYFIWGTQLENNLSYATSYIPTLTGSTVTRATETANGAGSADLINSTEGVLYAEIAALVDDGTVRAIYISNGTTSNRLWIEFDSSSNRFEARYISGGVTSANFFHTVTNTTDYNKIAFKWKVNDFALWINGVEVATDTSGGVIAANTLNRIDFHNQANSSVQNFYGKVKALAVFNEALSDSELTQLTT